MYIKYVNNSTNENGLSLETESLKTVHYLDITLDLKDGTYKPYSKPNDEILYIYANPIILQIFLKNYLYQSKLDYLTFLAILKFSMRHLKHYQSILNPSGYDYKLKYKPANNKNENRGKSPKNHKRNIIWFDPRFPNNVSDSIGKYFLLLIQQHFPNNHEYHTTKIMRNI